jgi:hypothetical protein
MNENKTDKKERREKKRNIYKIKKRVRQKRGKRIISFTFLSIQLRCRNDFYVESSDIKNSI